MNTSRLPDLYKKRIRVNESYRGFNPNLKGQCFTVKEVDWDSDDPKTRKPVLKVEHEPFAGYRFEWLKLSDVTVKE